MNASLGDDIHLLTGAYAVEALDELERARFEAHLDDCDHCLAEVAGLREAATSLTETTAVAPPAAVRERVLAGIASVRPLPPHVPGSHRMSVGGSRTSSQRWLPALIVAAALALIAGVGAVWQPWDEDPGRLTAAERVTEAADARRVSTRIEEAEATVVVSRSEGRAVLITKDMPPAPEGRVYELWYQTPEGVFVPAGLMPEGADQTVLLRGDATEVTGVGITIEPAGGSPEPTTAPIALFDLSEAAT